MLDAFSRMPGKKQWHGATMQVSPAPLDPASFGLHRVSVTGKSMGLPAPYPGQVNDLHLAENA
jgi:hypothetical protein